MKVLEWIKSLLPWRPVTDEERAARADIEASRDRLPANATELDVRDRF